METVQLLLRAEVDDEANWQKRNSHINSRLTGLVDRAVWERRYPVGYAHERLFLLGHDAIGPLLEVVNRATEDRRIQQKAWYVLAEFDDPRIRHEILNHVRSSRLTPFEAGWLLSVHLPIGRSSPLLDDSRVMEWLEDNRHRSYEELCLSLLDDIMKTEQAINRNDRSVLRWLNHMYDQDLDKWLEEKAPDALAFRNQELARGYDPIVAYDRLRYNLDEGILDEGIKALFADQPTQAACHRLLDVTQGYGVSPIRVSDASGWEKRIQNWYTQHRGRLKYDRDKHRFTADGPSTK